MAFVKDKLHAVSALVAALSCLLVLAIVIAGMTTGTSQQTVADQASNAGSWQRASSGSNWASAWFRVRSEAGFPVRVVDQKDKQVPICSVSSYARPCFEWYQEQQPDDSSRKWFSYIITLKNLDQKMAVNVQFARPQPESSSAKSEASDASFSVHFGPSPSKGPVTLAFSSCISFVPGKEMTAFSALSRRRPDAFLFLGDTIYSDLIWDGNSSIESTDDKSWSRLNGLYRSELLSPEAQKFLSETPSWWMFDDHDFKNDWDLGTTTIFAKQWPLWREWAGSRNPVFFTGSLLSQPPQQLLPSSSHYYIMDLGQVGVFVLDCRSHRSPNQNADSGNKTMLGSQQINDLKAWLLASPFKVKLIASSVPLHGLGWAEDSWGAFLLERNELLEWMSRNSVRTAFLSADAHFSGAFRLPFGYLEAAASPFSSFTFPTIHPEVVHSNMTLYSSGGNFAFGELSVDPATRTLHYSIIASNGVFGSSFQSLYNITWEI